LTTALEEDRGLEKVPSEVEIPVVFKELLKPEVGVGEVFTPKK